MKNVIADNNPDILEQFCFVGTEYVKKLKNRILLSRGNTYSFFTAWDFYIEADKASNDCYNLYYAVDGEGWSLSAQLSETDTLEGPTFIDNDKINHDIDDSSAEFTYHSLVDHGFRDEMGRFRLLSALNADYEKAKRFLEIISDEEASLLDDNQTSLLDIKSKLNNAVKSLFH